MVNFLDSQSDARRFAALMDDYDRRLQALERSTQAALTSIEGGAMDIYDADGNLKGSVGVQPDGGVALVPVDTTPPPTPMPPTVEPVLAGLLIGWDGQWDDSYDTPTDFALVQVHVGPAEDFAPDVTTLAATITARLGGTATVAIEGYDPVWVRLVAQNTATITGPPSAAVQGTPRQAVPKDLIDGIITDVKLAESAVTEAKIALGAVGSTALASGAVLEEKLAKAAVTLDKIADGAVHMNALGGALADGVTQRWIDAMADPAQWTVLNQTAGATWEHLTGIPDAPTGQSVGRASGYTTVRGTVQVPYDPDVLYRISARVRTTTASATGPDALYVGALGIAADGVTLVSRDGANAYSSAHYIAASNTPQPVASGWVTYVGYLRGRAAPGATGTAGRAPDPRAPGVVHDAVRFISPILYLNYGSGPTSSSGVMEVDAFTIEALKTGIVDSTNLVVGSVTTAALATDSVTAGKVAADAIGARELQAGSVTALEIAAGSITTDKLTVTGGSNVLPDPSFEGAVTAALIATLSYATQDKTRGNGSKTSLKLDCRSAEAIYKDVPLTLLPLLAGDQVYLATDYYLSAAWAGESINIHAQWQDSAGAVLGYGVIGTATPLRETWGRISGTTGPAPAGTTQASIRIQVAKVTAGDAWFDTAAVRPVVPGVQIADGAVTAPKILAGSITTDKLVALGVTAEKIAALAITTDKLNALAVTADKLAVNSVTATKIAAGIIDATHIKAGSLTADRLAIGADGGNLVPDPGFEGALTTQRIAGRAQWSVVAGNQTAKAVRVDCTATAATNQEMTLAGPLPAMPGQQVFMAFDYLVSADWAGRSVMMYTEWRDAAGTPIAWSDVYAPGQTNPARGTWSSAAALGTTAAPANTASAVVRLKAWDATAGTVAWDNAQARMVTASGFAGARAELSPLGLSLYDDSGDEAVALLTGRPNYLTLSTDGVPVATIDQAGNAGFSDLAVAGDLTIGGDPIEQHLTLGARGLVAIDYQAAAVTAGATDYGFVELAFDAESDRMYRVVLDCYADPSAAGGELRLILRDGGDAAPTISSPQIQSAIHPMPAAGYQRVRLESVRTGATYGAGLHRLLITFSCAGGPSGQTVRLFGGTNHHGLFYVEDVGPYIPETGAYNTGGGSTTPPVKQYTKTYKASWSGSYASRGAYNSYYGNKCMQGYYSSTNGVQASLIGFPAALTSDLSGAIIRKAEIYLYFDHWYYNAGGKAVIKAHKHASRPSTFSSDGEATTISWAKNVGKWVDITSVFDSTSWRGIALDPNSSDKNYYGRARGYGETYAPQLRVTYTK